MSLKWRILICGVLLPLLLVMAYSQTPQTATDQDREAICQRVPCRPATTVKLQLNDKEYAEFSFSKGPYVAEGFINVLNGEEFNVEFDDQNGQFSNPRYVKDVLHPERTLFVKLSQIETGTVLTVRNSFSRSVIYDCAIQHYTQQKFTKTSIMPVPAKLVGLESWPYPITQVIISNIRFQSAKAS